METEELKENTAEEAFTEYLENNGLKKSRERYVVLEAARKINHLFTAAELHSFITECMSFHISLTTVYSSLSLLGKCGITVRHLLSADSVVFEYAYGKTSFKYAICSMCGRMTHINDRTLDRAVSAVKTPRLHFNYYKTYIYGICASCARKEKYKLRKIKNKNKK